MNHDMLLLCAKFYLAYICLENFPLFLCCRQLRTSLILSQNWNYPMTLSFSRLTRVAVASEIEGRPAQVLNRTHVTSVIRHFLTEETGCCTCRPTRVSISIPAKSAVTAFTAPATSQSTSARTLEISRTNASSVVNVFSRPAVSKCTCWPIPG